jgi:proteic killer suppression protein
LIISFKCKETNKNWQGIVSKRFSSDIQAIARRMLRIIAAATYLEELRIPPDNRLEQLKGDRINQYSLELINNGRFALNGKTMMLTRLR